jgi:hypothetical protein
MPEPRITDPNVKAGVAAGLTAAGVIIGVCLLLGALYIGWGVHQELQKEKDQREETNNLLVVTPGFMAARTKAVDAMKDEYAAAEHGWKQYVVAKAATDTAFKALNPAVKHNADFDLSGYLSLERMGFEACVSEAIDPNYYGIRSPGGVKRCEKETPISKFETDPYGKEL